MSTLLAGPLLLAGLVAVWITVQTLWRRTFNLDGKVDVLADRCGCSPCPRSSVCQRRGFEAADGQCRQDPKEKGHGS